ncbi:GerMN domain-containing protein [Candidatus Woesebacteria bacterium]|nr:GerMN domain-containing protein [Candidatus Woesebacteria bacterium]
MKTKYIPIILITGMLLGLLFLGATYLFKSLDIIDELPLMPGSKGRVSFFAKSEVDMLDVAPTKINMYATTVNMFSDDKFNQPGTVVYTSSVERFTPRNDVATFALEEIIRGPTAEEIEAGFRPTFGENYFAILNGKSDCGIRNFTLNLDTENYLAEVKFCRDMNLTQNWSASLIAEEIRKTLIQFEKIQKVQILNKDGNCLDGSELTSTNDCTY